jgi:hypothetical protein
MVPLRWHAEPGEAFPIDTYNWKLIGLATPSVAIFMN